MALSFLISAGLMLVALIDAQRVVVFLRAASESDGIVVNLIAGGSHPEIEFKAASGQNIQYAQGGLIFGYKKGDAVKVLYRKDDPINTACIDRFGALWFIAIGSLFISMIFLIAGIQEAHLLKVGNL